MSRTSGGYRCGMAELESPADPDHYRRAFKEALSALDGRARTALFGSTAMWGLVGREPSTDEDLDLLVHPEDVTAAASALAEAGFSIEHPPEGWLLKAWHAGIHDAEPDILVDLIFEPSGLDAAAALERAHDVSVAGMHVRAVAPTDLMVTKLQTLGPQNLDMHGPLEFARLLRELVDWHEVVERAGGDPHARGFLHLARELGVVPDDILD